MANDDEINKINEFHKNEQVRLEKELLKNIEEDEEQDEEEPKKISKNKLIETITEEEHIKMAREFVIDLSSYTMVIPEKRVKFSKDLKENKTINDYVNNQALFKIFKSNNEHVRAGVVYSYLYIKNLNCL